MTWKFHHATRESHLRYTIFNSYSELSEEEWDRVNHKNNVYLSMPYLSSLEDTLRDQIDFKYIMLYDNEDKAVAIAYVQIIHCVKITPKSEGMLSKIGNKIKEHLLDALDFRVMICGNLFATGENGFSYLDSLSEAEAFENLSHVLFQVRQAEGEIKRPSAVILKEFWPESFEKAGWFTEHSFREFELDVNMVLPMHPDWNTIDDYLGSMVTKFRTKAKACFKKSQDVEVRTLDTAGIRQHKDRIQELYDNVLESADFHVVQLKADTFVKWSERMGDRFVFKGFFLNDEMVGFSTAFCLQNELEAGYIGLDYEYNGPYAVYQKILYEYVTHAISNKCRQLRLGRTAEQIKSTLGATPVNMKLYARHRNTLSNTLIKPIVESISPSEFELRKPFKAKFSYE